MTIQKLVSLAAHNPEPLNVMARNWLEKNPHLGNPVGEALKLHRLNKVLMVSILTFVVLLPGTIALGLSKSPQIAWISCGIGTILVGVFGIIFPLIKSTYANYANARTFCKAISWVESTSNIGRLKLSLQSGHLTLPACWASVKRIEKQTFAPVIVENLSLRLQTLTTGLNDLQVISWQQDKAKKQRAELVQKVLWTHYLLRMPETSACYF